MATRTKSITEHIRAAKPPEEMLALQAENRALHQRIKAYKKEHGQLESLIHEVLAAVPVAPPVPMLYKPGKPAKVSAPCDVAWHLSDIHYGAVQDSDEVEGFGCFSPERAVLRLTNNATDLMDWVQIKRGGYNVQRLHILLTGDYVSGDIHEELRVTNACPAPVQAVECGQLLAGIFQGLAQHFTEVRVHIVCDDNHGRLTRKPQAKEGGLNNWSFVVAKWIQTQLAAQKNVTVNAITRPWDSVECNGRRYLLTHGHHVMGWAGFPYYGIERLVAREAVKRMNAQDIRKFHKVVMGHWHVPLAHASYWIGGSVSGTDAFDHGQGRHSLPRTVSWMLHPDHGEFDRTEWLLRDNA